MATAKKGSYEAGISKSSEDIQKEQIASRVQEAKDNLDSGILSMQATLIQAKAKVRNANTAVTTAETNVSKAKYAVPFDTQVLLDARTEWLRAKEDLTVATEEQTQTQEAHDYLETTLKELF